jgi:hypothetical protein
MSDFTQVRFVVTLESREQNGRVASHTTVPCISSHSQKSEEDHPVTRFLLGFSCLTQKFPVAHQNHTTFSQETALRQSTSSQPYDDRDCDRSVIYILAWELVLVGSARVGSSKVGGGGLFVRSL